MAERTMAAWRSSPRIRVFMLGRHCRQQPIVTWGVGRRESDGTGAEAMRAVPRRGPAPEGRGTGQSEATSARLGCGERAPLEKELRVSGFCKGAGFREPSGRDCRGAGPPPGSVFIVGQGGGGNLDAQDRRVNRKRFYFGREAGSDSAVVSSGAAGRPQSLAMRLT